MSRTSHIMKSQSIHQILLSRERKIEYHVFSLENGTDPWIYPSGIV